MATDKVKKKVIKREQHVYKREEEGHGLCLGLGQTITVDFGREEKEDEEKADNP